MHNVRLTADQDLIDLWFEILTAKKIVRNTGR